MFESSISLDNISIKNDINKKVVSKGFEYFIAYKDEKNS